MQKLVELKKVSCGCPEQWLGKTESGLSVYSREDGGLVSMEIEDIEYYSDVGDYSDALDILLDRFEIPNHVLYPKDYCKHDVNRYTACLECVEEFANERKD